MYKKFLILLFCLALASSSCKDNSEVDGSCSACSSTQVLVNGYCYNRIRGCLVHSVGPICSECQFGYVLSKSLCVRSAIFEGNTDLNPAPIVSQKEKHLTFTEIEDKLGKKYGPYFSNIHEYFLLRYPYLGKGNINSVESFQTKNEVYLSILYSQNGRLYNAEAEMNSYNKIKQIQISEYAPNQKRITQIVRQIQNQNEQILRGFFLYRILIFKEQYAVDFMNSVNQVVRVTFKRSQKAQVINFSIYELSFFDIARQRLLNALPEFRQIELEQGVLKNGLIIFSSVDKKVSVSMQFRDYQFIINQPIYASEQSNTLLAGQFSSFRNLKDPKYLAVLDHIKQQFPELQSSQVISVQNQIVSGINFLITFFNPKTQDKYIIKAFHDFRGVTQLIEAQKNDIVTYKLSFNYNEDINFLENYLKMAEQSKVFNIPSIGYVSKKIIGDTIIYRANYDFEEFLEFHVNLKQKSVKLIAYNVGGENLVDLLHPLSQKIRRRSPTVLLNFLKAEKPQIMGEKIKQITFNQPLYKIIVVMNSGTYQGTIEDRGQLYLIGYNKIQDDTCFDLSATQGQTDQTVAAVDQFLKTHYPIFGYNLQSVQIKVQQNQFSYRYLYSNDRLKQIEFFLLQKDNQITVSKASILDYGYQIFDQLSDQELYLKVTNAIKTTNDFSDIGIPYLNEANATMIRSYFSNDQKTIEILVQRQKGLIKRSTILSEKSYLEIPSEFSFQNLVFPQIENSKNFTQDIEKIKRIISCAEQKYSNFIKKPEIKFAQRNLVSKQETYSYTILIQTERGLIKFLGQLEDEDCKISNVIITNYDIKDFSNCRKFDLSGKCVSCSKGQVLFQNSCFPQIEGCLIQPGGLCIKCDANYVKSNYKCFKDCKILFA